MNNPETKKVLIADDEEDICLYLKKYLERRGLKVATALNGLEAKKLIEQESFDYFLLDCSMPEITGIELIDIARSRNPHAKIALISGSSAVNEELTKKMGGNLFIYKPIKLSDIDAIL